MEVRRKTSEETRINLIVIGLPIYIQDRIDKVAVQSTNDLIGLLGQYEDQTKRKKTQESNVRLDLRFADNESNSSRHMVISARGDTRPFGASQLLPSADFT